MTSNTQQLPLRLHLNWFRSVDETKEIADAYLSTARDLFPLAVPTRFGTREPMQGRFPRDDDAAFDVLYKEHCYLSDLNFYGKAIEFGFINGWANDLRRRFQAIRVAFDYEKLNRLGAVPKVEDFFVATAQRTGSFFAFAELNHSVHRTAEPSAFDGGWGGLPSQPQWLTWYGPAYADLVRPSLAPARLRPIGRGAVHRWTELPSTEADLKPLVDRDPWISGDLLATVDPVDPRRLQSPARSMPPALRPPAPGSPDALRIEAGYAAARAKERHVVFPDPGR